MSMIDRVGLAAFLRRRREALQPEDVGLDKGRRRRTSGLRREEVAALAHMSTDFYARLEQRRGSRPSEQTVKAIAHALRLTQDERDHLFQLAGHTAPPRSHRSSLSSWLPGTQNAWPAATISMTMRRTSGEFGPRSTRSPTKNARRPGGAVVTARRLSPSPSMRTE